MVTGQEPTCRGGRGVRAAKGKEVIQPGAVFLAERAPETGSQDFCFHSDSVTLSKSFPSSGLQFPHLQSDDCVPSSAPPGALVKCISTVKLTCTWGTAATGGRGALLEQGG